MSDFKEEIAAGDYRRSLVAMRDLVAHELSGKRCNQCNMLQMRSGETSALVLRLQKIIEDIDKLPTGEEEVTVLDELQAKRQDRETGATDTPYLLGSKGAQRRQGGRRTGGVGGSAP